MKIRLVKQLATAALILTVLNFWYAYDSSDRFDETTVDLLSLSGFNAIIIPPPWLFFAYYGAQIIVLCALVAQLKFSKHIFAANIVFFAVFGLFTGIAISSPVEVFIATIIAYIYGAIILLSFFSLQSGD